MNTEDDGSEEDNGQEQEEEKYVEIDPREQYKGAKPTQISTPKSFVPMTSLPLETQRSFNVGSNGKVELQEQGGRPRAGTTPSVIGRLRSESNLRVQAAVQNVQASKSEAVKNIANSFQSRENRARAKGKPVQMKFKAISRDRKKYLSANNPMYRNEA